MGPQLILIDGYNVIKRTTALAATERHSLETAREALRGRVVARYRGTPHQVVLVFDGDGPDERVSGLRCGVGSRQIFSAAGTTADAVIRRLVEEARAEGDAGMSITVYSDDWEVGHHAQAQGARAGSVGDLTEHLAEPPRHLRKRAQHHAYLREREDASETHQHSRKGNAHKPPRRRRDR